MANPRKSPRRTDERKSGKLAHALDNAGTFSIRVVSRLTSIEPDTLRMWERRYGFPKPKRTEGNSRLYSGADIRALHLIVSAMSEGYRPGEVVGKSESELEAIVKTSAKATTSDSPEPFFPVSLVDETLSALRRDQIDSVRAQVRRAAILLGPSGFVTSFAHPASIKVGEEWARGVLEVRQEHAFTECLSTQLQLLLSAFDEVASGPHVLLATLPDEHHGLALETIALYLAAHRVSCRLLGVSTPPEQIASAARAYGCDAVGISIMPSYDSSAAAKHIRTLRTELGKRIPIWVGGAGAQPLRSLGHDVTIVTDWPLLDAAVAKLHSPG